MGLYQSYYFKGLGFRVFRVDGLEFKGILVGSSSKVER